MSRLTVCNIMSLDGFYADPAGNPLVLPMDAAFDRYNLSLLRSADRLLLGADSYRMFMNFWPAQAENPSAGEVHREFGSRYGRIPVSVVSDSLTEDDVAPWKSRTTVVPRAAAAAHVRSLTGDTVVFGSRTTWNALLRDHLVDELHLIVGAAALGTGTPVFTAPATGLTPLEPRTLDDSTNVLLRYARA